MIKVDKVAIYFYRRLQLKLFTSCHCCRYLNKMHDDLEIQGEEEKELENKYVLPLLLNM